MPPKAVILDKPLSQMAFSRLVGVTRARITQLCADGVLREGGTGREWLLAYCEQLREGAAGRAKSGELDLSQERAALAREQRITYEIKNAVARGEYAPISLLADVLAEASQGVVDRFAALPAKLKKARPHLTADDHHAIHTVLTAACREWSRSTATLAAKKIKATSEAPA